MDIPEFTRLDLGVVWRLGRDLVEQCLQEAYGVTICAKVGQQHVFHAALPGTSADNDSWVHRKLRVVEHFGIASLAVQEQYGTEPRDFYRIFGLEPSRYAPAGGAVPLLVEARQCISLHDDGLRGRAFGCPLRRDGAAACRHRHRRPAQLDEGECCRDQHEPTANKQRDVQAVDEGAFRERLCSRAELLRDDAALSTAHVLDDVRGTCLG